jgi:NAD(P)-dependent dehydrogenase (short-subunit alcohol dehydrogenase family)
MRLQDRVGLVTGAASGIGRAIALSLARRGCHVALADRDAAGLVETAALLPAGVRVSQHVLDVSDAAAIAALPAKIMAEHGRIDLLVNNAGVAIGGTFEQVSAEDFDWLFAINFHAVVRLTRAFLPLLKASDDARLVNISSLFGLIAPPGQTAYVASKFAVRGFSESLRHELAATPVGVTVVHPGGVATAIARNARPPVGVDPAMAEKERVSFEAFLKMPPAKAGETIVKGVERRRPRIVVGNDAKFAALIERIAPVGYWSILSRGRT